MKLKDKPGFISPYLKQSPFAKTSRTPSVPSLKKKNAFILKNQKITVAIVFTQTGVNSAIFTLLRNKAQS